MAALQGAGKTAGGIADLVAALLGREHVLFFAPGVGIIFGGCSAKRRKNTLVLQLEGLQMYWLLREANIFSHVLFARGISD